MAVQWNGDQVQSQVKSRLITANFMASEALKAQAQARTPFRDGELKDSAKATSDGLSAATSFNTVYAARQHEETTWAHTTGEAGYLRNAKDNFGPEFLKLIAQAVKI